MSMTGKFNSVCVIYVALVSFLDVPLKEEIKEWSYINRILGNIVTKFSCLTLNTFVVSYFSESDPASGTGEINPEEY